MGQRVFTDHQTSLCGESPSYQNLASAKPHTASLAMASPSILRRILLSLDNRSLCRCMRVSHKFYDIAGPIVYEELPFDVVGYQDLRLFEGADNRQLSQTEPPNFKLELLQKVYSISLEPHDSCYRERRGGTVLKSGMPALRNVRTVHLWFAICDCDDCEEDYHMCDMRGRCEFLLQLRPRKLVVNRLTPPLLEPHSKKDSLSPMTDDLTVLTLYLDGYGLFRCDPKKENDVSLYVVRKEIKELRLLLRLSIFRKDYPELIRRLVNLITPLLKASCKITVYLLPALEGDLTGGCLSVWKAGNDDLRRAMSALMDRTPDCPATLLVKEGADYLKEDVTDELSIRAYQKLRKACETYVLVWSRADASYSTNDEPARSLLEPHEIPGYRDDDEHWLCSSRDSRTCVQKESQEDEAWQRRRYQRM